MTRKRAEHSVSFHNENKTLKRHYFNIFYNSLLLKYKTSVVDPNRLCSDPDPGTHVHLHPDPGSEQDPNKFESGTDLKL